ncbi:hypothetical protein [Aminobacter sp. LjRoot7]|uniref:hypothetical protein n=1 Tax=Aminobacter sp. LjRoot7 TaxID=3342335 RepID=UPI003F506B47
MHDRKTAEEKMIVEATNYFAKEGLADDVLTQRRKATEIRRRLGLDPGRILVRTEGDGPDIRWECSFASREAYDADRAARTASPDFEAARKQMHTLLERFERHVYEVEE